MTEYLKPSFSVGLGGAAYSEGWDRVFGDTRREIFNRVRDHLLKQGCMSTDSTGWCFYRGEDGRSCAVGCLIKDEFYDLGLEGRTVESSPVIDALRKSGVHVNDARVMDLLVTLQRVHDYEHPANWAVQLAKIEATL